MHDGESANLQVIGRPVVRIDAREKVTGEALYSADRFLPQGVLYGKTLRSAHPHAEILRVDISEAEGLPGVRAVVTFRDAPQNPFEEGDSSAPEGVVAPVYVLNQVARHVGDEVAAVAADSLETAEEALRLIEVHYKPLPFVLDADAALAPGAPLVRGGINLAGRKPIFLHRGDIERRMGEADLVFEETYRTQATSPLSLEPRYSLAQWKNQKLTVWKSSRNVYGDRDRLAKVFDLPQVSVRVIAACFGGGFGGKDETRLAALTALLAL